MDNFVSLFIRQEFGLNGNHQNNEKSTIINANLASSSNQEFIDALNNNLRTFECLPSLSAADGVGQNQTACEEPKGCNWAVCTDSTEGCTEGSYCDRVQCK